MSASLISQTSPISGAENGGVSATMPTSSDVLRASGEQQDCNELTRLSRPPLRPPCSLDQEFEPETIRPETISGSESQMSIDLCTVLSRGSEDLGGLPAEANSSFFVVEMLRKLLFHNRIASQVMKTHRPWQFELLNIPEDHVPKLLTIPGLLSWLLECENHIEPIKNLIAVLALPSLASSAKFTPKLSEIVPETKGACLPNVFHHTLTATVARAASHLVYLANLASALVCEIAKELGTIANVEGSQGDMPMVAAASLRVLQLIAETLLICPGGRKHRIKSRNSQDKLASRSFHDSDRSLENASLENMLSQQAAVLVRMLTQADTLAALAFITTQTSIPGISATKGFWQIIFSSLDRMDSSYRDQFFCNLAIVSSSSSLNFGVNGSEHDNATAACLVLLEFLESAPPTTWQQSKLAPILFQQMSDAADVSANVQGKAIASKVRKAIESRALPACVRTPPPPKTPPNTTLGAENTGARMPLFSRLTSLLNPQAVPSVKSVISGYPPGGGARDEMSSGSKRRRSIMTPAHSMSNVSQPEKQMGEIVEGPASATTANSSHLDHLPVTIEADCVFSTILVGQKDRPGSSAPAERARRSIVTNSDDMSFEIVDCRVVEGSVVASQHRQLASDSLHIVMMLEVDFKLIASQTDVHAASSPNSFVSLPNIVLQGTLAGKMTSEVSCFDGTLVVDSAPTILAGCMVNKNERVLKTPDNPSSGRRSSSFDTCYSRKNSASYLLKGSYSPGHPATMQKNRRSLSVTANSLCQQALSGPHLPPRLDTAQVRSLKSACHPRHNIRAVGSALTSKPEAQPAEEPVTACWSAPNARQGESTVKAPNESTPNHLLRPPQKLGKEPKKNSKGETISGRAVQSSSQPEALVDPMDRTGLVCESPSGSACPPGLATTNFLAQRRHPDELNRMPYSQPSRGHSSTASLSSKFVIDRQGGLSIPEVRLDPLPSLNFPTIAPGRKDGDADKGARSWHPRPPATGRDFRPTPTSKGDHPILPCPDPAPGYYRIRNLKTDTESSPTRELNGSSPYSFPKGRGRPLPDLRPSSCISNFRCSSPHGLPRSAGSSTARATFLSEITSPRPPARPVTLRRKIGGDSGTNRAVVEAFVLSPRGVLSRRAGKEAISTERFRPTLCPIISSQIVFSTNEPITPRRRASSSAISLPPSFRLEAPNTGPGTSFSDEGPASPWLETTSTLNQAQPQVSSPRSSTYSDDTVSAVLATPVPVERTWRFGEALPQTTRHRPRIQHLGAASMGQASARVPVWQPTDVAIPGWVTRSNTNESLHQKGVESEGTAIDDEPDLLPKERTLNPTLPMSRSVTPQSQRRHSIEIFCDPSRRVSKPQPSTGLVRPQSQQSSVKPLAIGFRSGAVSPVAQVSGAGSTLSRRSTHGPPTVQHATEETTHQAKLLRAATNITRVGGSATSIGGSSSTPTKGLYQTRKSFVQRQISMFSPEASPGPGEVYVRQDSIGDCCSPYSPERLVPVLQALVDTSFVSLVVQSLSDCCQKGRGAQVPPGVHQFTTMTNAASPLGMLLAAFAALDNNDPSHQALKAAKSKGGGSWIIQHQLLHLVARLGSFHQSTLEKSDQLVSLYLCLGKSADNLRSSVAKQALGVIGTFYSKQNSKGYRKMLDIGVPHVLPICMRKAADQTNLFLADAASNAATAVCENASESPCMGCVKSLIATAKNSNAKGNLLRASRILATRAGDRFATIADVEKIASFAVKGLRDAASDSRAEAKLLCHVILECFSHTNPTVIARISTKMRPEDWQKLQSVKQESP